MPCAATDHAFFRTPDRIRIAWPVFLVSSFARTDRTTPSWRLSVAILTISDIQGPLADAFDLHPAPPERQNAGSRDVAIRRKCRRSPQSCRDGPPAWV